MTMDRVYDVSLCLVHGVTLTLTAAASHVPMTPQWSVPDDYVLGVPRCAAFSKSAGHVYLSDRHESRVHVFDVVDGAPVFTFGRSGEGPGDIPGEIRRLVVFDDGSVGVVTGALDLFDSEGMFLRRLISRDGTHRVAGLRTAGEHVVIDRRHVPVRTSSSGLAQTVTQLMRWSESGAWGSLLHEETFAYRPTGPNVLNERETIFLRDYDIDDNGTVYMARSWDYVIEVIASDGSRVVWNDNASPPAARTDEDFADLEARMNHPSTCDGCPSIAWEFETHHPAVRKLRVGDDGALWVLPWSGVVEPGGQTWDIWRDGVRTRVRYEFEVNYLTDRTRWLSDELVLLTTNENEREQSTPVRITLLSATAR